MPQVNLRSSASSKPLEEFTALSGMEILLCVQSLVCFPVSCGHHMTRLDSGSRGRGPDRKAGASHGLPRDQDLNEVRDARQMLLLPLIMASKFNLRRNSTGSCQLSGYAFGDRSEPLEDVDIVRMKSPAVAQNRRRRRIGTFLPPMTNVKR
jgi:hypothetical protein